MATRAEDRLVDLVWGWSVVTLEIVLVAGAAAALFGWRAGALAMVAAVAVRFVLNLVLSTIKYRRTMRRRWPEVRPVESDDD